MIHQDAIIDVTKNLRERATDYLNYNSFGLDIMSVDVGIIMSAHTGGMRPVWIVVYQARGVLLGHENYLMQGTLIDDPFVDNKVLHAALADGCRTLREEKAKQGNGVH